MTTIDVTKPMQPEAGRPAQGTNYLNHTTGIKSWLLTMDHKRIGIMYLVSILTSFFLAGIFGLLVRTELLFPGRTIMDADGYNMMFTLHGAIMVFLVIIHDRPAGYWHAAGSSQIAGGGSVHHPSR